MDDHISFKGIVALFCSLLKLGVCRLKAYFTVLHLSLVSHALRACEARALRTRKTLTARFTDFFPDFEKKNRLFFSLT